MSEITTDTTDAETTTEPTEPETEPTEPETTTTEEDLSDPNTVALAVAEAGDARVEEEDLETVAALMLEVQHEGAALGRGAVNMTKIRRKLARISVQLMALVHLPSGLPDWDGTSKGFHRLFDDQLSAILSEAKGKDGTVILSLTKQERKNLCNAVRQGAKKVFLEPAIRAFVYDNVPMVDSNGDPVVGEDGEIVYVRSTMPNGYKEKDGFRVYADGDSDLFKLAVKREMIRCDITPPDHYLSPEEKAIKETQRGLGGPGDGPADPAKALRQAVDGSDSTAVPFHAAESLALVSSLARRIGDPKRDNEYDRPGVTGHAERIQLIAAWIVAYHDEKTTGIEEIEDLLWSSDDAAAL